MSTKKCAIVIDQNLPIGLIANTAGVLALTIGKEFPELIGHELKDSKGDRHHGITTVPIPILKGTGLSLKEMRETLKEYEPTLTVVDFTSAAQTTTNYEDYSRKLEGTPVEQLEYLGIALYGSKKVVNKFTGNLGLLR